MKNHKGFTLMELMIVIAMIGILSSVTVPSIRKWADNSRFYGGVDQIRSSVSLAKMTSLKQSVNVLAEFTPGLGPDGSYRVYVDDGGGTAANANNRTYDAGESVLIEEAMPRGVTLSSASFGTAGTSYVLFNPAGLPMESSAGAPSYYSGSVVMAFNGESRRVRVTAGGVIKLEKQGKAGGGWVE